MPDTEKEKDQKKITVMDVSHPGTSSPSATARPIITGSGTMLRDPMVRDDTKESNEKEPTGTQEAKAPSSSSRVIQPLSDSETDELAPTEKDDVVEATDSAEKTDTENKESTQEPESEGSAIINAVVDRSAGGKNTTKQVVDTEDEHLEELVRSKQYYVKIHHSGSSPLMSILVITLLIIAIAAFFYYADMQGWITLPL